MKSAGATASAGEGLLVLSRLGLAARAVRSGAPGAWAGRGGAPGRARDARAVAVTGACAALTSDLAPGHLVVASEIRAPSRTIACPSAPLLAGVLRRRGFVVHCGPVVSTARSLRRAERARHRAAGAIAVDLGSPWLAAASGDRPLAVVRAVVAAPAGDSPLPVAAAMGAARACRLLARASGALAEWAAAVRPRRVLLAGPRASCAGVERAIDIVEIALERYGPPIYVRKQIVHNVHVVGGLERRGAVFVDELDEVPEGARVVFSAHGVSPRIREQARARGLEVIDATCPLVAKVHAEARRFARSGHEVLLIGHAGHEEVEGTTGEAPDRIRLVESLEAAARIEVEDPERVAYVTQTTLAVDETRGVLDALRRRFPALAGPTSDDICYATQNRQDAVKALAAECDLVLVIGSRNSSNSRRLAEVAERHGCPARLVDDESEIEPAWLTDAETIGLTAGASAPEALVRRVIASLAGLGPLEVEERAVATETVQFRLPPELR